MDDNKLPANGAVNAPVGANSNMYHYNFWDKEIRVQRGMLTGALLLPIFYTTLLMWGCLSLYWGSLLPNNDVTKISVYFVNLDAGGSLGDQVLSGIQASITSNPNHLAWNFDNGITNPLESMNAIVDEQTWAVVQVSPNASFSLTAALSTGNSSYSSLSAVALYYASARNQITVNSHVVPSILGVINPILSIASAKNTAEFLDSVTGNQTALGTALKCTQCLAGGYAMASVDLIPFDSATAQGSTMVGLIFLLTFTFSIFQILHVSGQLIGGVLKLSSALAFRTIASLISYFILSLSYSLVNLAFGVPFDRHFGHGGFVIYWMLNWCTMGAVGLPMESLFTLIGLKWAGYFLSFWIIVNVSPAFTSFDIMPSFFQYGYAFPFYHSIQGARTIIFGTKNHLGLNFGVLIAWCVVGLLGMYALTWFRTRQNMKVGTHLVP